MLEFVCFEEIDSTQVWLVEALKRGELKPPVCVMSEKQTQGRGSRENRWESVQNALLFSLAFNQTHLPDDLALQSLSIYVGYLFKEVLKPHCPNLWLKWPNDLYLEKEKVGGIMTQTFDRLCVCGIGLNLQSSEFCSLDLDWNQAQKRHIVLEFWKILCKFPTWKEIFSNYKIEFHKNFDFYFHDGERQIAFSQTQLREDGSICVEGRDFYSLR